jgi:hypothetical protein
MNIKSIEKIAAKTLYLNDDNHWEATDNDLLNFAREILAAEREAWTAYGKKEDWESTTLS